jgi:hypothetical protein
MDAAALEDHLDRTIRELYGLVEPEALSRAVAVAGTYLEDLATAVVGRVGTSISIKALFEASERDPRVWELLNWHCPPGELGEIEHAADAATVELAEHLSALPGEYGRLLNSGAAMNQSQMRQALVVVGVKPGLEDGTLIPEPIDTSYLRGMTSIVDYYISAIGARKALTTNFRQVKASGYLARKLVLLTSGHIIDPDLKDCETRHAIETEILSEDHVGRLVDRYIALEGEDSFRIVPQEELRTMVGRQIRLRSPITCGGLNGCCHICYGELARSNAAIHAGVYGSLVISNQITNRLLSSKHLLKARPTQIIWPEEFLRAFSVERATIVPESTVERVWVNSTDLDDDEGDDDEGSRMTTVFYYRVAGRQARRRAEMPVPIYLDDMAWKKAEPEDGAFAVTPVLDAALFRVPVGNTDLSEALTAVIGLIEREEITSYHIAYTRLLSLLERAELHTPSVHAEMILRALVRRPDDHTARPDFSGEEVPPSVVLRLTPAIIASPSVTNALAFERVKFQLTGVDILSKSAPGALDALFGG